jgi:hypothetical protein
MVTLENGLLEKRSSEIMSVWECVDVVMFPPVDRARRVDPDPAGSTLRSKTKYLITNDIKTRFIFPYIYVSRSNKNGRKRRNRMIYMMPYYDRISSFRLFRWKLSFLSPVQTSIYLFRSFRMIESSYINFCLRKIIYFSICHINDVLVKWVWCIAGFWMMTTLYHFHYNNYLNIRLMRCRYS